MNTSYRVYQQTDCRPLFILIILPVSFYQLESVHAISTPDKKKILTKNEIKWGKYPYFRGGIVDAFKLKKASLIV